MSFKLENIMDDIQALKGPVFTIYLKTDPTNENWKIQLKNGLKRTEHLVKSAHSEDVKVFSKMNREVDVLVKDNQRNLKHGLICFLTEETTLFYLLQVPVENEFHWEEEPATDQLNEITKKYPKSGVVVLQQDQVSILSTYLGEVMDEAHYELDLDKEDWKQYKGLGYEGVTASSANHRDKFDRRVKENQERWFKNLIPTINKYSKEGEWEGIYLTGAADLTNTLEGELNRKTLGTVNSDYSGRTPDEIVKKVLSSLD